MDLHGADPTRRCGRPSPRTRARTQVRKIRAHGSSTLPAASRASEKWLRAAGLEARPTSRAGDVQVTNDGDDGPVSKLTSDGTRDGLP
ncbi:hypothetical protein AKJ09_10377 [Labilithrix luteola]|uniref:Uncharacterized protein n=1 Tax=Labilithrix luteola TaxID=1391654 RepID=A0A0K1QD91_9BACT|nr:hypothetical protein AKJ09_10377 [Labilithrix luteola]